MGVLQLKLMHSDYTIIPKNKVDMIKEQIERLRGEPRSPQSYLVESIIFNLDLWTHWDDEMRRIVGEAEEERCQASTEVSDISTASV